MQAHSPNVLLDEPPTLENGVLADALGAAAAVHEVIGRRPPAVAAAPCDVLGSCAGDLGPPCQTPPQI